MDKDKRVMLNHFVEAVLTLKTEEECRLFFEDICSIGELENLSRRLEIAKLVNDGELTYRQIVIEANTSNMIISRVKRVLEKEDSMLKRVVQRIND